MTLAEEAHGRLAGVRLVEEAERYLAVVEVFRAEGFEPHWRPESPMERCQLAGAATQPAPGSKEGESPCSN